MNRVSNLIAQAQPQPTAAGISTAAAGPDPKLPKGIITEENDPVTLPTKADGWGFPDTELRINQKGDVELSGSRYLLSGKTFPSLRPWLEEKASLNVDYTSPARPQTKIPSPIRNQAFLEAVKNSYHRLSFSKDERYFHAHGHTAQEVFMVKFGNIPRIPDAVMWPTCHDDVEEIVKAAVAHDVCIIPYGGGTSVSQALLPPENETRMIISLDMHCMNRVLWIDKKNMLACIECGIVGADIEPKLSPHGVTLGHEPDSIEFSTLGGWIATRASGMRKNKYGNIEDIVTHIKTVTPQGVLEKSVASPRISAGPDLHHVLLGSEGTLGVFTQAIVRLRPKSAVTKYGSVIFPNFKQGVDCLHEVAMKRLQPVSIRLVDNMQFQFGQALKPESDSVMQDVKDKIKKWYVLNRLKFDPDQMVAATLLFEGEAAEVALQEKQIFAIAAKYGGVNSGEENGIRGYFLTYIIAYLRDLGTKYQFIAESFETTLPYSQILETCAAVKKQISATAKKMGVKFEPFVSCRISQLYDTGACVYFYFGFIWHGTESPVDVYSAVEHEAREEILRNGGSISHHHGIGKIRSGFLPDAISQPGVGVLKAIKQHIDPKNIFAAGNLVFNDAANAHH